MSVVRDAETTLAAQIEGLLFVATEPVSVGELAATLDVDAKVVEAGITELEATLQTRGLRLQRHSNRVQLTTAPQLAGKIERFLGLEALSHLGRSGLETLAIIAYNQPITRPQIDSVRGVNSDSVLKSLLLKGLIFELGRTPGPGRPILYATTPEFLQHLGLNSAAELPVLRPSEGESEHDALLKG